VYTKMYKIIKKGENMTTEQKIYNWVLENFGEAEANKQIYNIIALAKYIEEVK